MRALLMRKDGFAARRKAPLASHPAFVQMLAIWGAALAGSSLVAARMPWTLAAIAAVLGGAIMLGTGMLLRGRAVPKKPALTDETGLDEIEPIVPALELGSESLDAPIIDNDAEIEDVLIVEPAGLTLEEFGAMPGRNAVWVEDPVVAEEPHALVEMQPALEEVLDNPAAIAPFAENAAPELRPSALDKLRQIPPGDLSLVQMVERFAGALHERQAADLRSPERDAALAEALRALDMLSEEGFGSHPSIPATIGDANSLHGTMREMRDALARLQELRGAA